jgi:hypothetical protein
MEVRLDSNPGRIGFSTQFEGNIPPNQFPLLWGMEGMDMTDSPVFGKKPRLSVEHGTGQIVPLFFGPNFFQVVPDQFIFHRNFLF